MRISHRRLALAAVSLAALLAGASQASAGAFAIREQSAQAQGLSFAGAASGSGGLSSMFWNPAAVTMAPGWNSQYSASAIIPSAKIQPLPGTSPFLLGTGGPSGDIVEDALVVSSYSSYQLSDQFWIGMSTGAPFGLATKPRDVWAGQVYSRSSKIFSINFNPVLGYKVNDWLSVAAGPMIEYFDVKLKRALSLGPTAATGSLEGDDVGMGFTAGVMLTPFAGTRIGVGYRSSIRHALDGTLAPAYGVLVPIRANLNTPDQVTVGLSQKLTPDLTLDLGFEWTNWSRLGTQAIVGPAGFPVSALALNYKDGYFYSAGLEYQWSPQWAFRAGVAYEESPIDDRIRSTRLPDNDRYWASVGASYQWSEKLSFDVAYSHIFTKDTKIRIVPGHQDYIAGLPFVADVDAKVDIVSVGLKYRWDNPVAPIPAPIVTKY